MTHLNGNGKIPKQDGKKKKNLLERGKNHQDEERNEKKKPVSHKKKQEIEEPVISQRSKLNHDKKPKWTWKKRMEMLGIKDPEVKELSEVG